MSDPIERQAAIDALDGEIVLTGTENADAFCNYVRNVTKRLKALPPAQPQAKDVPDTNVGDCISRQDAIDAFDKRFNSIPIEQTTEALLLRKDLRELPPAQPQRDIPKKPNETIDRSWGIPTRQAVCPNCDAYLGAVHFIGESDKKKVTYCESCGQAIDWTDWEDNDG